jgi:hypothetical protein
MNDIITDVELAFKDMIALWDKRQRMKFPDKYEMRFQRFKVLRAVCDGASNVYDISEKVGSSPSTTAAQLEHLLHSRHVEKTPVNMREYSWRVTLRGKSEVDILQGMKEELHDDMHKIVKTRMEKWI